MGALGETDPVTEPQLPPAPAGNHARINLVTTVAGFVLSLLIGLWYTPFLVRNLGPATYGLIPLATAVVSYFSVLTQTLSSALSRTLSVALVSGDERRTSAAFGNALGGAVVIVLLLLPALAALSWLSPHLFAIPPGMKGEVRVLFAFVGMALLLSILSIPYGSLNFGQNRIYVGNTIALTQTLARVGLTALLFLAGAELLDAGWGIMVAAVLALGLTMLAAKAYNRQLSLTTLHFNGSELKGIARTSGHVLLMQLGTVLVMSLEVVLANRLFGAFEGGRYAAVTQWLLLLRNATMQMVVLAVPTILRLVASKQRDELVEFTVRAMLWSALATALPVGFLCAFAGPVLTAWLGPGFEDLWPVVVAQLLPLTVVATVLPLYSILLGADRMLVGGLVQIGIGVVGVVAGIVLGWGWGALGVALGINLAFALKEVTFMPIYAARVIEAPRASFYRPIVTVLALVVLAGGLSLVARMLFAPAGFPMLFVTGLGVSVVYAAICAVLFPSLRQQALALANPQALLARVGVTRQRARHAE